MINGIIIQVVGRNNRLDNMFHQISLNLLVSNILVVLSRNNNGVNSCRNWFTIFHLVFTSYLGLTIRTNPRTSSILTYFGQLSTDRSSQVVGQRHKSRSLISSITKHNTLVTSTSILFFYRINRLSDIRRLFLNSNNNVTGSVIKTFSYIIVSDVLDSFTDYLFVVNSSLGRDFTENHYHTSLGTSLTGNTGFRILLDARIKNCVRYLITDLIRVTFIHRFRGKKKYFTHC